MERILIYYSLDGHTRFLAEQVQTLLGCDRHELQLVKQYPPKGFAKYYTAGRNTVLRFPHTFKQPLPDLSRYDVVILATPVWAGRVCAPMYSYIKQARFPQKDLYLIANCSGGDVSKCFSIIKNVRPESHVRGEISFINPNEATFGSDSARLKAFCDAVLLNESFQ
ncbi:MAG: hypothetical protein VB056_02235 [Sphaerochaeta associata]|uniref:flavodoxin family protein n=1 Tax=Sphaerochaeta associata TaxID=1129264 RepID=UPI002B1F4934|nr:hypothetical protein [Sphaerochaeta associata]MEA5027673.1 hypothetical protein [Sphaerochaeta associata]